MLLLQAETKAVTRHLPPVVLVVLAEAEAAVDQTEETEELTAAEAAVDQTEETEELTAAEAGMGIITMQSLVAAAEPTVEMEEQETTATELTLLFTE